MKYRQDKYGNALSVLGYGCMRFPQKLGRIGCGKCEGHCPQHIEIRKELKQAAKELEPLIYRLARRVVAWLRLF